uniref:AMOP domain-containing protein n=1 Tax=Strongyloides stercoralis TaxID=6248 RepID=A0A0K0E4E7_STRER
MKKIGYLTIPIIFQTFFTLILSQQNTNQNLNTNQQAGTIFTGTGSNIYYGVNLVPFGPDVGDLEVAPGFLTSGQTIDLHMFFPFYGGLYNYTTISVNGYLSFTTVLDQGPTINVGPDSTDWPRVQDPAMIAPWLCKQQITQDVIPGLKAGVFFRLLLRQSLFGQQSGSNLNENTQFRTSSFFSQSANEACRNLPGSYVRCDEDSDEFLNYMQRQIQSGVAGGNTFRPDGALVVTWYNTGSAISGRSDLDSGQLATYQAIWLSDSAARLSYVVLNYDKLGFDADDFRQNSRSGRCRALFNGGNHTGLVEVDPTQAYKNSPKVLAQRSGVPHIVRGRYMFRVDDVVRPAGCSNKTGGTYPMLIYPNIINMLGEITIDINAMCLDRKTSYILMIERRQIATCVVLNAAIARCTLPKIYDWGTKTLYFQPQTGNVNDDKAFVGYAYFVPPTLDPMRLDIGYIYKWFKNPIQETVMPISWYPRNFTNPDINIWTSDVNLNDENLYSTTLGLYVIGYKEAADENLKKFNPQHRVLCRLTTYSNRADRDYSYLPQEETININQVQEWYLTDWERNNLLYSFRFGYLKLAPVTGTEQFGREPKLLSGLVSAPISLHWLWSPENQAYGMTSYSREQVEERKEFVIEKATQMCHDWYDEDGALTNFIKDTETNHSCPCIESQAKLDIGRFMPHPRCSQEFRDITCTEMIGSENCYMSAQNVYASYMGKDDRKYSDNDERYFSNINKRTNRYETTYGQVCCYDQQGFLMQTPYQPVVRVIEDIFYNPGFPNRAYEFGSNPYLGQFEVPGLSVFHHDLMPYYLCCKFAKFRCQMFYWRRPSSACQAYQPPAVGRGIGGGSWYTLDNQKFIFNEPGVFNLLYIPKTETSPEVKIQVRTERYPNRKVDWSLLGHYLTQADLVQPTNVTVITGIAMEASGTDRVVVTARGDTRRFRYRTNIFVKNILRYFDHMKLQRFEGVLVYVNNVVRGIPDIYIVLEEAEIGVRIKESYSLDIDRLSMFQESMGMLDIEVSVPPRYGVSPDGREVLTQALRDIYNIPTVSGLLRPFPEQTSTSFYSDITINEVNSDMYRSQIINNYKIPGTGGTRDQQNIVGTVNRLAPTDNLFTSSRDEDSKFEVFPEVSMKNTPIYKVAPKYETGVNRFTPMTGTNLQQLIQNCIDMTSNFIINQQPLASALTYSYGRKFCPDNPEAIISECGDNIPCRFDWAMFNSRIIGLNSEEGWENFVNDRIEVVRAYNSCGAINIEYPEYMTKTPSFGSGYLQGDTIKFDCDQTHWIKGESEYKCSLVVDYEDPSRYRYEWNKGGQPWCRPKEKDNYLQWLTAIFSSLAIILAICGVFLICWCYKKKRQSQYEKEVEYGKSDTGTITPPYKEKGKKNDGFDTGADDINLTDIPSRSGSPYGGYRGGEIRSRIGRVPSVNGGKFRPQPEILGYNTSV